MKSQHHYEWITTAAALRQYCHDLSAARSIGFDTEFVSEDTYRPELCLVQVAADGKLAAIDPLAVEDLTPFWNVLTQTGHQTVVHAGREEFLFCLGATQQRPAELFDLQIAAGLVGLDYPAGYGSLMSRLLNARPNKGETRTDWRRRPLTTQQLDYALDDVRYLHAMQDELLGRLTTLQRVPWMTDEMTTWQGELEASLQRERWRRTSGISGLSSRSMAIVREVWQWREEEAARRNQPVRRVLRDDLIVELAKRKSADPRQIGAVRGMERKDLVRAMPYLAEAIDRAIKLPDEACPRWPGRNVADQFTVLGQFVASALGSICRAANLAPSMVGTASDVRDLIAYRLQAGANEDAVPPALARGWRAEVVGHMIDDLLSGKRAIRIGNPAAEDPLEFVLSKES